MAERGGTERLPQFVPESQIFRAGYPWLARNTVIESIFEVGRCFRWPMRVDCGQLDPGAVIRSDHGEWHLRMPERLDEEELADWRGGSISPGKHSETFRNSEVRATFPHYDNHRGRSMRRGGRQWFP